MTILATKITRQKPEHKQISRKTSSTSTYKRMQQVYLSAEAVSWEFIQSIYLMMLYLLRSSSCTPTSIPCMGELDWLWQALGSATGYHGEGV